MMSCALSVSKQSKVQGQIMLAKHVGLQATLTAQHCDSFPSPDENFSIGIIGRNVERSAW